MPYTKNVHVIKDKEAQININITNKYTNFKTKKPYNMFKRKVKYDQGRTCQILQG